jgi:hypothetical protein
VAICVGLNILGDAKVISLHVINIGQHQIFTVN